MKRERERERERENERETQREIEVCYKMCISDWSQRKLHLLYVNGCEQAWMWIQWNGERERESKLDVIHKQNRNEKEKCWDEENLKLNYFLKYFARHTTVHFNLKYLCYAQ